MSTLIRTRWAAIGAAVAATLGVGGLTMVDAAKSSGDRPVTVLLDEPCRLRDTRPGKAIGGRTTPIGEGEAYTVQGTGPSGGCDIPTDALGLVTNVTAVLPSTATDLRLYPSDAAIPPTSNLNPAPGQPPTPNSVTVGLSGAGQFDILNKFGSVHVIIDVAAYLVDHTHDDLYTLPFTVSNGDNFDVPVTLPDFPAVVEVISVDLGVPANGDVTLHSSVRIESDGAAGADHLCNIFDSDDLPDVDPGADPYLQYWELASTAENERVITGTRSFPVTAGTDASFSLVCQRDGPFTATVSASTLTATYTPAP